MQAGPHGTGQVGSDLSPQFMALTQLLPATNAEGTSYRCYGDVLLQVLLFGL